MKLPIAIPALDEESSIDSIVQRCIEAREFICPHSPVFSLHLLGRSFGVVFEANVLHHVSLAVRAVRRGLRSCLSRLKEEASRGGLRTVRTLITGMISQNNKLAFLVPMLQKFDRPIWWGEYLLLIAGKTC